ncbi:MAG: hypothetical protein K2G77_01180, partial [Muribaculaceae bacterium]|nr:hypothetical protein [Muribaculaceae bacterium]
HTFIYYLYFPFLIYWSRNPVIIFISLLISSIAVSIGIEKLKDVVGFYRLQEWIIQKGKNINQKQIQCDSDSIRTIDNTKDEENRCHRSKLPPDATGQES